MGTWNAVMFIVGMVGSIAIALWGLTSYDDWVESRDKTFIYAIVAAVTWMVIVVVTTFILTDWDIFVPPY